MRFTADVGSSISSQAATQDVRPLKKSRMSPDDSISKADREERNAREKERSLRISSKISEIRDLLSSGGVIIPKPSKSSVLTEAATYIRMLERHLFKTEIDRQSLIDQVRELASGKEGARTANVVRRCAAQNGVWSLGNFTGFPPQPTMTYAESSQRHSTFTRNNSPRSAEAKDCGEFAFHNKLDENDFRTIFICSSVGMVRFDMFTCSLWCFVCDSV